MTLDRRRFLAGTAAAACGAAGLHACSTEPPLHRAARFDGDRSWNAVRELFALSDGVIHMSALYVASHPRPVSEAIERYRRELDANPVVYLNRQNRKRVGEVLQAAASYLGVDEPADIALTDSTTSGIGLVYNGLRLNSGDEIITTEHDYYATHEALRLASERKQVSVRKAALYDDISRVTEEGIVDALLSAVTPKTRALALTWVHSGTGLKLPLARIAARLEEVNARRDADEQVLLCVDGVHGFGVENTVMPGLGCDFFMAGCHKWLFGPRGTGIVWGSPRGWRRALPTVPSFLDDATREAWMRDTEVTGRTNGRRMSPGGFKPFEHQWAMKEAFDLHQAIGKPAVAARTHALARQLKEGLAAIPHVMLRTPMPATLSAGIVCCEVEGMNPWAVVERLGERDIVATVTPYSTRYVRFAPSVRNTHEEVDAVLRELRGMV